ncbi:helix-turn-helix domain-containing protein [Pantoea sp. C2G6]|uniref:helix-turn-helix domain-containing protein n=1 Tax=Pantoea sp. C2G6 TaxID=3243084 RepID=UPI003ED98BE7
MLVSDDHYFISGFIELAKLQGIECEHVTTRDYPAILHFRGTVLIDLVSWYKSSSLDYSPLVWPHEKNPGAGLITSCKRQEKIIDLICNDCFKLDRKSTPGEIKKLFCSDALPHYNNEYDKLTPRESEILTMRLSGMGAKKIALLLQIEVKTVYAHLYAILVKSGCRSLIGFYALALPLTELIFRMDSAQNNRQN